MILIYFNIDEHCYYYYLSKFDSSKIVGETNKFGDILIGLYLLDYLEYKLVPYRSSFSAEIDYNMRYNMKKEKERLERRKAEWEKLP